MARQAPCRAKVGERERSRRVTDSLPSVPQHRRRIPYGENTVKEVSHQFQERREKRTHLSANRIARSSARMSPVTSYKIPELYAACPKSRLASLNQPESARRPTADASKANSRRCRSRSQRRAPSFSGVPEQSQSLSELRSHPPRSTQPQPLRQPRNSAPCRASRTPLRSVRTLPARCRSILLNV